MSMASVGSAISACGCCRADAGRRDARSPEPARPARRAARRATAGTRGAGGAPQMLDDQRAHGVQWRRVHRRCAPTVSGFRRRGEAQRVAGVVVGNLGVVDVDRGRRRERTAPGRAGRPVPTPRRCRSPAGPNCPAAVRLRRAHRRRSGPRRPPRRRPPVRSPAAGSATGAAAGLRWCPRRGSDAAGTDAAQPVLAGIDVGDKHRRPGDGGGDCAWLIGPSPSPRASTASRPAQPIRTSAHHSPGCTHGGGATSKPSLHRLTRRQPPRPARRGPSTPRCPTG